VVLMFLPAGILDLDQASTQILILGDLMLWNGLTLLVSSFANCTRKYSCLMRTGRTQCLFPVICVVLAQICGHVLLRAPAHVLFPLELIASSVFRMNVLTTLPDDRPTEEWQHVQGPKDA
jgi:hypothetical protein